MQLIALMFADPLFRFLGICACVVVGIVVVCIVESKRTSKVLASDGDWMQLKAEFTDNIKEPEFIRLTRNVTVGQLESFWPILPFDYFEKGEVFEANSLYFHHYEKLAPGKSADMERAYVKQVAKQEADRVRKVKAHRNKELTAILNKLGKGNDSGKMLNAMADKSL